MSGNHNGNDKIIIRDLLLRGIIGVNEEERRMKQDILITITLLLDLRAAGTSDCLDDSVNYRGVCKQVIALVEQSSFFLLEKLAEEICRLCLGHAAVRTVTVCVDKPTALRFARSVAVEITRGKEAS